jgi:DNA repair protein RecO (recombination protein O)
MTQQRVSHIPAFVLHSFAWRETSLIVELFTRDEGRITTVAKGAKRRGSSLRPVLQQFCPLSISFSGRGDVKTLTQAEWQGGFIPLSGDTLMCGFYLNELILRLVASADPHPNVYDAYLIAIDHLQHSTTLENTEAILRRFEWALLQDIGFAPSAQHDMDLKPIEPDCWYECLIEKGFYGLPPHMTQAHTHQPVVQGKTLNVLSSQDLLMDLDALKQSKRLMRYLFRHHLGGRTLKTRDMMIALQQLF